MRIKITSNPQRIVSTVAVVLAVTILLVVLFSCAKAPLNDSSSILQGQTSSVDSLENSQENDDSSANAQQASNPLPPVSAAAESVEDEVIVYQDADSKQYHSPVDTKDVTWELLNDNEVRITSKKQEAVYAAEAGTAIVRKKTGWNAPFNYVLIYDDNGVYTVYRNLDNFAVEFGDKVEKGQKLGEMHEENGHYSFRFSIRLFEESVEINIPTS